MKTSAPATTRPSTASGARLRRLAVVGLVAPVVALAACSGESPVTADPTAPAGTTPAATSTSTTSTTTAAPTTAAPTTAAPVKYSTRTVKAVIKDPQLGHTITAMRVSRGLPFPKNQPVGAEAFEIVGVKVEFAAGSRYSASLDPKMLTLIATNPKQNVAPTADPLLTTKRDERDRGWVFFKVDKGTTTALRLAFNRPAYAVSTTDKNIPAKTFSVVLTK